MTANVNNVINQTSFLRTSREFPNDPQLLTLELDKSYVDIANAVNSRTIGIFPVNRNVLTGESWFYNKNQKQNTLRQVYRFSTFTNPLSIPHGINTTTIGGFTRIYGTATNGTNWYPLPYVDVVAANNQINVIVTPTNIVITAGAGAPPAITSGFIVLEWLSQP